jgi:hypothetical protein
MDVMEDVRMVDYLGKEGLVINYKGLLKKEGKIYVFYGEEMFENLGGYSEELMKKQERVDERFCI